MLSRAQDFSRRLLAWYDRDRRDLPWRVPPGSLRAVFPDPYHVLVSEAMLQQTQVATVVPYFRRFLGAFPTIATLAQADEQDVLRLWQGLGYYSRARNLRAAAQTIVRDHGGEVPKSVEKLRTLRGVGAYTAGAVASIAFDCPAPIVDGNVARVLCRVDRIETEPKENRIQQLLWRRAKEILPGGRCGDFNSSMMELGAVVCTPRNPRCPMCPVNAHCEAFAAGVQDRIPLPRKAKVRPLLERDVFCVRSRGSSAYLWLIEQRAMTGRWAGMWQFITLPSNGQTPTAQVIARHLGTAVQAPRLIGTVQHGLTHRRYAFNVYLCVTRGRNTPEMPGPRKWVMRRQLSGYPLSRPQVKITELLDKYDADAGSETAPRRGPKR